MDRLKVVIITYNIYPKKSPRSFRSTELAVELAKQGHDVTLYCIVGKYNYHDFTNKTNVIVKDLGKSFFGCYGGDGTVYNINLCTKIMNYFLGNIFYLPSIGLFPNVLKAIKAEGNFDYLITIAVPYVNHWAPSFLSKREFKVWASDCGDPFMGNPFKKYPSYFKFLEKRWGKKTDFIVIPIEEARKAYYQDFSDKIRVIPQGFNFDETPIEEYKNNEIIKFAYAGNVYAKLRDPSCFLEFLCRLNKKFIFYVYTNSPALFEKYKKRLGDKLIIKSFIDRKELVKKLSTMDFLVNIKNIDIVQQPSKLIDYYISRRPILDVSSLFDSIEKDNFYSFLKKDYSNAVNIVNPEQYNIVNVAKRFIELYYECVNK